MYLTAADAHQESAPSYELLCQVRVQWWFGDTLPDVIEFWWKGGSDDHWTLIPPQISIDENNPAEDALISLPAGVPGAIHVCPRLLDDRGVLKYYQPDDDGEDKIWNGFCIPVQFVGRRLDGDPPDRCRTAPQITAMDLEHGSVTVRWTNPEGYDRFIVNFAIDAFGGNPHPYSTENQFYRFERVPAGGCWARVVGIHDGNDWTGTSECHSPESNFRETSLPPELGYVEPEFTPGAPFGAVSRTEGHFELFGCLPDGRPMGIWSYNAPGWHPWYSHGSGPGFPASAPLTALSRAEGFMDLFGVSNYGSVCLGWWHNNPWREWYAISANVFPGGAWVAALSRNSDQMDIFAVGSDGTLRSTWWNGSPWRDWFRLDGASFPPGSPIATLSRNSDQMDIFAIDSEGVVRSNWWNGNPWRGWFSLAGVNFPPGASIAATSRNSDQMDIFAIGADGVVYSNWWNGNPWRGWFSLDGMDFPPGAPIAAYSYDSDHMTVAAVATDSQAYINRWNGSWSGWEQLGGAFMDFPPGANVTLRNQLYCVANDGFLYSNNLHRYSPSWSRVS